MESTINNDDKNISQVGDMSQPLVKESFLKKEPSFIGVVMVLLFGFLLFSFILYLGGITFYDLRQSYYPFTIACILLTLTIPAIFYIRYKTKRKEISETGGKIATAVVTGVGIGSFVFLLFIFFIFIFFLRLLGSLFGLSLF